MPSPAPHSTASDAELVALARRGQQEAFAKLVERHQSVVWAVTYSACGDRSSSEDIAQEAFIKAWTDLETLQEDAKFRAWVTGIARNLCRNANRKAQYRMHEDIADHEVAGDGGDPKSALDKELSDRALWAAMGELEPSYREALVLFYQEEQ